MKAINNKTGAEYPVTEAQAMRIQSGRQRRHFTIVKDEPTPPEVKDLVEKSLKPVVKEKDKGESAKQETAGAESKDKV